MSQDPSPPTPVIILVSPDDIPTDEPAIKDFIDLLKSLGASGLNCDRLALFGLITGNIPADRIEEFKALPGIDDIEPDQTMHLLDDDEAN